MKVLYKDCQEKIQIKSLYNIYNKRGKKLDPTLPIISAFCIFHLTLRAFFLFWTCSLQPQAVVTSLALFSPTWPTSLRATEHTMQPDMSTKAHQCKIRSAWNLIFIFFFLAVYYCICFVTVDPNMFHMTVTCYFNIYSTKTSCLHQRLVTSSWSCVFTSICMFTFGLLSYMSNRKFFKNLVSFFDLRVSLFSYRHSPLIFV